MQLTSCTAKLNWKEGLREQKMATVSITLYIAGSSPCWVRQTSLDSTQAHALCFG